MTLVPIDALQSHLRLIDEEVMADYGLLEIKLAAAENHIERLLGYRLAERFGAETADLPPALFEAILQLAAWWYENRETAGPGSREVPFGVSEIVAEYREFTF